MKHDDYDGYLRIDEREQAEVDAYVERILDTFPPLTDAQLDQVAALLKDQRASEVRR